MNAFKDCLPAVILVCLSSAHAANDGAPAAVADLPGGVADVPLHVYNNLLVVDVAVNGGETRPFILDTGAGGTLIATGVVAAGAAEGEEPITVAGVSGTQEFAAARLETLALGKAVLRGPVVACGDLTPLSRLLGFDIAGILGYDFLRNFVVKVDYDAARLTLYTPAAFGDGAGVDFIPATYGSGNPLVEMAVDDVSGKFVVDLGNPGAMLLNGAVVRERDLVNKAGAKLPAVLRGAGGDKGTEAWVVRMGEVRIGEHALAGPIVVLPTTENAILTCGEDVMGNVGWDLASRFVLYFDYPGGRLGLVPGARFDAPFDYDRAGLVLLPAGDGCYVVDKVASFSPAAALLAPGDRVVGINGEAAADVPAPEWGRIRSQPAGTPLTLTVERADGRREEVTFALAELL